MPFEAKLDENNRWVVLSKIVPWEEFARLYYKNFKSNRGAPTKDARLVQGVIIIKHIMKTDDRGVIEMIQENMRFLKLIGIRYIGELLGRMPVKEIKSRYQKRKERREAAERNQVEGKFGQGKRGYGLNDIRARLSSTSNSWIGAIIFVMNLIRHMRDIPLPYFVSLLQKLMIVRNINIYPLKPQMELCA